MRKYRIILTGNKDGLVQSIPPFIDVVFADETAALMNDQEPHLYKSAMGAMGCDLLNSFKLTVQSANYSDLKYAVIDLGNV